MGKIYAGQSDLTIKLETGKNLTGISNVSIITKNPLGVLGAFPATVMDATKGTIQYAVTSINDINAVGNYIFWAKVVDAQGLISIGEPTTLRIYKEGY
ncbi:hypothetical protein ACM55H_05195 [Flavobacterium sp. ZT3R17]|uniref:hypothetical protein n=1 Tax=Flavobacterium cryoconiti TaxID=3398736 RepID=UPI003A89469F